MVDTPAARQSERRAPLFPAELATLGLVAVTVAGLLSAGVPLDGALTAACALAATAYALTFALPRLRLSAPFAAVARGLVLTIIATLFCQMGSVAVSFAATGYADAGLARIDAILFGPLSWSEMTRALAAHPWLSVALSYIYVSLNWQPFLWFLIAYKSLPTGLIDRFVSAWTIGLLICLLPFRWVQALGPYTHYGIPRDSVPYVLSSMPWDCLEKLTEIHAGRVEVISLELMVGLITAPSFHALAAVLLAWAFWHIRPLRWPMVVLNVMMMLSAIPIGGHYYIDILLGVIAAAAAIALSGARRPRRAACPAVACGAPTYSLADIPPPSHALLDKAASRP